ncbi:MAG: L-lactate permease [Acidobacteria bacterium]|nr:L-lactate permease [Acidobacteriota bacterium]
MAPLSVFLAISPVLVIFLLLLVRRTPADTAGVIGWGVTVLVAWLWFRTDPSVIARASVAGIIASFPISLMVGASIFQMTFMQEVGAIRRIVLAMKSVAPTDRISQILMVNVGFGTLITALGATPVSILPPMMLAMGYSSYVAIALPAVGYDSLCTYALLGIPAVVYTDVLAPIAAKSGIELTQQQTGLLFARFIPLVTMGIALAMFWIVGRGRMLLQGLPLAMLVGLVAGLLCWAMALADLVPLTGVAAGLSIIAVLALVLALRGRPVFAEPELTAEERASKAGMGLVRAASPWLLLLVFAALVNLKSLPLYHLFFERLPLAVPVMPGRPLPTRALWQAYTWVLVATLAAAPFFRPALGQWRAVLRRTGARAPRPMLAAAIFFAIAYVIDHSGKIVDVGAAAPAWVLPDADLNMIHVVAGAAAGLFGAFYGLVAPYLGLLAGFISGSETSAIAMLSRFHMETAAALGRPARIGLLLAAASAVGGGLASVISPAKLQNAAAIIDCIGEEGAVLRTTTVISLLLTVLTALLTLFLASC